MAASWWTRIWDRMLRPPKYMRPMGLVAVQMTINPFELFLLLTVCLIGSLYLIGLPPPSSVRGLLGPVATFVWAGNLVVGGFSALGGGLWRRHLERGLAAYQFGWGLLGTATLVYGLALVLSYPEQGSYPALLNVMMAAACFGRVIQVQRFFKLSEQLTADEQLDPLARRGPL